MLRLLPLLLLLLWPPAHSAIDIYEFDTDSQRERYHRLVDELRCPKCQNQNLAGSNSQIAADLRRELYRLLQEGKTDREIKQFMVARYGDFVLYRPPLQTNTLLLWLLPVTLLLVGVVVVAMIVRHRRLRVEEDNPLSTADQSRLQQLLNSQKDSDS